MNQYEELYRQKLVTLEEALSRIQDGDVIATSQCANEPTAFFQQMHTLKGKVKGCRMYTPMCFNVHPFMQDPEIRETFEMDAAFLMGPTRNGREMGALNFYPADLHNGPSRWISTHGCTVFIAAATPMDQHGYFQIPLCLIHEREFLEHADRIMVQVNPNLPRVYGDTEFHIRDVDCIVEAASPLPYLPESRPSQLDAAIGGHVASLIHDGDTIQLGIGGIPDAAAFALMDKHDLGIHSEMLTNTMVDLVEAGVVTGKRKSLHPGKMIGTFAYGSQRLYDMLDGNPSVRMLRGSYVNDPGVVAQNDNFVSVNSCLSVDLTGQVCSESIGSRQYSGSGGQVDMAVGAAHARCGRNIIAVASTKRGGTVSSVTAQLAAGSVVTLSRNEVDYVVTEYGIAHLKGRSVRERVENLIAVAHPDFRAELRQQANQLMLW
ncbi:MAG: acetyl-CoA hydrolase/transferase family protein [Oscillospiraceae bacterium]|nr:acetyl-CoA hydrolase/transferase family protein [Oscillospiraceae bacterium]